MTSLWDYENPVTEFDISVPAWIEQDTAPCDIIAILEGGCASGAYMPAVTYNQAAAVMAEHGDDVLDYLQSFGDDLPQPQDTISWSGLASFYLSCAVEMWASSIEDELCEAIEDTVTA